MKSHFDYYMQLFEAVIAFLNFPIKLVPMKDEPLQSSLLINGDKLQEKCAFLVIGDIIKQKLLACWLGRDYSYDTGTYIYFSGSGH